MWFLIYFASFLIAAVTCKHEEYMGYKVYNIELTSPAQQKTVSELKSDLIDFWRRPNYRHGVVGQAMVPPSHVNWFEEKLEELGIQRDLFVEDVYEYLTEKEPSQFTSASERSSDIRRYLRYNDILEYLRTLSMEYTNSSITVDLIEHGTTEQNRPIVYLKLSREEYSAEAKPVVVVEAGINPREWITIPAALNVVDRVIEEVEYLDAFDWIVVPVVNPDGYEYTHTNLRLWSKSLSTRSNLGFICPGVNINRNFAVDWSNFDSSSSPCSHLYAGIEPFSENETQLIRNIIQEYKDRIKLYISLQNNGGFVSYPWSYERAASGMFRHNHLLALDMIASMNDSYAVDVSSVAFDRASGTSSDFARINDVLYSFNIDVADRGDGVIIPEEDIGDIVEDVWAAVAIAARKMMRL